VYFDLWVQFVALLYFALSLALAFSLYLLWLAYKWVDRGPTLVILPARNWQFTLADPIWLSPIGGGVCWSMVLPFGLFLAEERDTISKVRINHTIRFS